MSDTARSRHRFRFSLGELLVAFALVAIGLTWPLTTIFVLPLLATKIFRQMGYGSYAPVISTIGLSMIVGVLISYSYWHYPFETPATLAPLRKIGRIDQLSQIIDLGPAGPAQPAVAMAKLPPASSLYWNQQRQLDGADRLIAEFVSRNTQILSAEPVSNEVLMAVWNAADRAGLLISGESGYPNTKTLRGYVGIARERDGSRFAFAALIGREQSNDHYPYYEFVVPLDQKELVVSSSQWFYVDISGIEGINWLAMSVLAFVVMMPLTLLLQLWWIVRQRKGESRARPANHKVMLLSRK
jgi:hypothetical protein